MVVQHVHRRESGRVADVHAMGMGAWVTAAGNGHLTFV